MKINQFFEDFIDLIFPRLCVVCNKSLLGEVEICTSCRAVLPFARYHECVENPLYLRLQGRFELSFAVAFLKFQKRGHVQKILHQIKYAGNQTLLHELGQWYGNILLNAGYAQSIGVLVPVPLHKKKLQKRGYNQSEVFCEGLAKILRCEICANAVIRKVNTKTQTSKNNEQRWENMREIFEVVNPKEIYNKNITLVDDVVTTGATIEWLAMEIKKHHPKSLGVLALADALK